VFVHRSKTQKESGYSEEFVNSAWITSPAEKREQLIPRLLCSRPGYRRRAAEQSIAQ
jgi:hypothetical protein